MSNDIHPNLRQPPIWHFYLVAVPLVLIAAALLNVVALFFFPLFDLAP